MDEGLCWELSKTKKRIDSGLAGCWIHCDTGSVDFGVGCNPFFNPPEGGLRAILIARPV